MYIYIYIYIYICIYIHIYNIFSIHLLMDNLGCLHVLAIVICAAMNTGVHVSF